MQSRRHSDQIALQSVHSGSIDGHSATDPDIHSERPHSGENKTHLVEFIDQKDIWQRAIDHSARTTFLGMEVSNLNFLVRQQGGKEQAPVHHYPTNRIARQLTAHEPDRLPVEAFELPDKSLVDELLEEFFDKVNPGFPVVDQVMFMAQYRARDPASPPSLLLLHAMLLAGAHVSKSVPQREKLKTMFFKKAKMLFDTRFERNRDTVVQAALLLTWHSEGPEDVAANSWYWIGVAARTALGLGMHRDAEPSTLVPHNKRMWRRVWWLLFQCDVFISLQYGRPQALHLEDCDTQSLTPSDFAGCGDDTAVDFVIHSTELAIALSSIIRKLFGPRANSDRRSIELQKADAALARWALRLPEHLRLRPTLTLGLWPAILQVMYNNALILLHRPRPHESLPRVPFAPSLNDADICSAAAGVIQSIFEGLRARDELRQLWPGSVNILFTAMIQLSVEARISNPILAIAASRRFESTLSSLRQLADYWPSAESVLHLFESSQRLRCPAEYSMSGTTPVGDAHGQESPGDVYMNYPPTPAQMDSSPNDLAVNTTLNESPRTSTFDASGIDNNSQWLQLFPHTDVSQNIVQDTGDEWREIYWQQPELVQDFMF